VIDKAIAEADMYDYFMDTRREQYEEVKAMDGEMID
jgi:hypothetical protein